MVEQVLIEYPVPFEAKVQPSKVLKKITLSNKNEDVDCLGL